MQLINPRPDDVTSGTVLAQDVAKIKAEHPYKGDYRQQLAALLSVLFFKHGERVGAARLVGLLAENGRSPSTSTAQDEINKFWERVRANASVKISRPDIPPFLQEAFGDMAATLWSKSMAAAEAAFEAQKQEVDALLREAQEQLRDAAAQVDSAQAGAAQASLELAQSHERMQDAVTREVELKARAENAEKHVRALEERLEEERQLRQAETSRLKQTLEGLQTALGRTTNEQNRLLAIGDDYKQQAARDRDLREKAEKTCERLAADNDLLRAELQEMSLGKAALAGRLEAQEKTVVQVLRDLGQPAGLGRPKSRRAAGRIR